MGCFETFGARTILTTWGIRLEILRIYSDRKLICYEITINIIYLWDSVGGDGGFGDLILGSSVSISASTSV